MNTKKFVIGSIVVWLFIFFYEWIMHGIIMADMYEQYSSLFRTDAEMMELFWSMALGQIILAFGFCYIFIQGYKGDGLCEGLRYGFYIGVAFAWGPTLIQYSVYPFPSSLNLAWAGVHMVEMLACGALIAALYKPAEAK